MYVCMYVCQIRKENGSEHEPATLSDFQPIDVVNLENMYIFQVVVAGRFHSITGSLLFRHPAPRGGGGVLSYEKVRDANRKLLILFQKKTNFFFNVGAARASLSP